MREPYSTSVRTMHTGRGGDHDDAHKFSIESLVTHDDVLMIILKVMMKITFRRSTIELSLKSTIVSVSGALYRTVDAVHQHAYS